MEIESGSGLIVLSSTAEHGLMRASSKRRSSTSPTEKEKS